MKTANHAPIALVLLFSFGCAVSKQIADSSAVAPDAASAGASPSPRKLEPLEELVRARANLTEKEVLAIAASVAKLDPSRFQVLVRAHLESKRIQWWVRFRPPGITLVGPGTDTSL